MRPRKASSEHTVPLADAASDLIWGVNNSHSDVLENLKGHLFSSGCQICCRSIAIEQWLPVLCDFKNNISKLKDIL